MLNGMVLRLKKMEVNSIYIIKSLKINQLKLIQLQQMKQEFFKEQYQILSFNSRKRPPTYLLKQNIWNWNQEEAKEYLNLMEDLPLLIYIQTQKICFRKFAQKFRGYDVLQLMSHTSFISLRVLDLSENMIRSIQILQKLKAPSLKHLSLERNRIRCIKALRKCDLNELEELNLKSNPIVNWQPLEECNLKKMKIIYIYRADQNDATQKWWRKTFETNPPSILRQVSPRKVVEALLKSNFNQEKVLTVPPGTIGEMFERQQRRKRQTPNKIEVLGSEDKKEQERMKYLPEKYYEK